MISLQRGLLKLAEDSSNATSSSDDNSTSSPNGSLTRLKCPSKHSSHRILREKFAKGLSIFGRPITMVQDIKICGVYKQNSIINDVQIVKVKDSHEFYFHSEILTCEQKEIMLQTPTILFRNREKAHAANPYHADIGQMKLYFDGKTIQRCKVVDLFCYLASGRLELQAHIQLIDEADKFLNTSYSSILDYPQRIRYIQELEPESKKARLYLGCHIPEDFRDPEVEEFFANLMEGRHHKRYHIKILDYKSSIYYVDIIDQCERSAVSLMLDKFAETKLKKFTNKRRPDAEASKKKKEASLPFYNPTVTMRRKPVNDVKARNINLRGGALDYFKQMWKAIRANNPDASYIKKRFFRVLVIDWMDPDHITIQPAEKEYYQNFGKFIQTIQEMDCVKEAEHSYYKEDKHYEIGEHILFKNNSLDKELGKWLRGVVVSASCFSQNSLVLGHIKTDRAEQRKNIRHLMASGLLEPEDLIYLVRATDFGYHFSTSHSSMRHLKTLKEFRSLGTWGLRCQLFGVNHALVESHKQLVVQKYSDTCRGMMDSWIRERILDTHEMSHYYVLFRTDIEPRPFPNRDTRLVENSYDYHYDITLFHRYEPLQDAIIPAEPRKTRFDCLNWFLVERGAASDQDKQNPELSSNIQLDSYIVNKLVSHDMI